MDLVNTNSLKAPVKSRSAGPSSPHPGPMEDPDSTHLRKRPRTDSGERAHRSMSADVPHPKSPTERTQQRTHGSDRSLPSTPTVDAMPITPTKVTINLRESQTSPQNQTTKVDIVAQTPPTTEDHPPVQRRSSSPKVVSVHSTPPGSPEIQVAEVEDITAEPSVTRWRPLHNTLNEARTIQNSLLRRFPYVKDLSFRKTFNQISNHLDAVELEQPDFLTKISEWIDDFLDQTAELEPHWWSLIVEEREFWDGLPTIFEALVRRSESKVGVPAFQIFNDDILGQADGLTKFLNTWATLCARMTAIDRQTLNDFPADTATSPDLLSDKYVLPLQHLIRMDQSFWKNLVDPSSYNIREVLGLTMISFLGNTGEGVTIATDLIIDILERPANLPGLVPKFISHFNLLSHMAIQCLQLLPHQRSLQSVTVSSAFYRLFECVDSRLQNLITKQVPGLSLNLCNSLMQGLSNVLTSLARSSEEICLDLYKTRHVEIPQGSLEEKADLLVLTWKFQTLRKCIVEGRMEIRVQGVDAMERDLVNNHKRYVEAHPEGAASPVALYLADFLIRNRIVPYLLSADSHPQLISRSANIVGFLVVTGKLTNDDTDVIWNAVVTSQESRSSEVIIHMLTMCLHLCNYQTLLYIVSKVNGVTTSKFDSQMRHFAELVIRQLGDKWRQQSPESQLALDMLPFDLCMRLMRESSPDQCCSMENQKILYEWASRELNNLLRLGANAELKEVILRKCLQDATDLSTSTTGSTYVLYMLACENSSKADYIKRLSQDMQLAEILVADLSNLVQRARGEGFSPAVSRECLSVRLHLLECLLNEAPETLEARAARSIWETLVGADALDDDSRDVAWDSLIRVARRSRFRNGFIDLCISNLLPNLAAKYMVPGCLSFAEIVRLYISQTATSRSTKEEFEAHTASNLLWHLSLNYPAGKANMEIRAINLLIQIYLDSPDAHQRSREANDTLHVELVEKCISQLTNAAHTLRAFNEGTSSGDDEPAVVVATEDEVNAQKLSFVRSLMILKEFVHGVRSRPMYSPSPELPSKLPSDFSQLKGDPVPIKYQTFSESNRASDIKTFEVGKDETVNELSEKLTLLTGFAKLNLISGGQRLDLTTVGEQKLRDMMFERGLLLVKKASSADRSTSSFSTNSLRPMEIEVLRHFDDLYQLLSMEDDLARQVFDFLTAFPPHTNITDLVTSSGSPVEDVFPAAAPFKILYSVHALKLSLNHSVQPQSKDHTVLLTDGIRRLSGGLITLPLHIESGTRDIDLLVAGSLAECLSTFFRAAQDPQPCIDKDRRSNIQARTTSINETAVCISDPVALIERCLHLISVAAAIRGSLHADRLVYGSFSTIFEASLISSSIWELVKGRQAMHWLLKRLLLEDERPNSRQAIAKLLKGSLRLTSSPPLLSEDYIPTFCQAALEAIPTSLQFVKNTEQFFDVVAALLTSLTSVQQQDLELGSLIDTWTTLLLQHKHTEVVGRNEVDYFVHGLSRLISWGLHLAKKQGQELNLPFNLLEDIFKGFLFPNVRDASRMPDLCSATRERLYSIVLCLSDNELSFWKLVNLLKDLDSDRDDDSNGWTWGIASTVDPPSHFTLNWHFERISALRSSVGYSGLRNLSNTCYMNSLFTQLFMNVSFRDFMLNVKVADGTMSQKLLNETRILFGYMQDSSLKGVDTQNIADSIITYDNTAVDVTHQVDVDEFYNLLFDRWESQILHDEDKRRFRRFFGGQIVQQIKSKECSHISERLEPFSAIQCDIAGKTNLVESLNAYVQGEAMEGDNKYSCTSCAKYVDANKRACFKDVPDNIIFHLKRFDYDLMHGTRTKINDRFEFPLEVDMTPYNVDYLREPPKALDPDIFSLVGVLVHSGTAESGHYYSYIQERPASASHYAKWVEFNDLDVSEFNPADIDSQCFGGWQDLPTYDTRWTKPWNAYMLFYERRRSYSQNSDPPPPSASVRTPVPGDLGTRINIDNQIFLRQFCQYDAMHALFIRNLLRQLRILNDNQCSQNHEAERAVLELALDCLTKILARSKETAQFDDMLATLAKTMGNCSSCCDITLQWISTDTNALHDLVLRCPHAKVRKDAVSTILLTLQKLRRVSLGEDDNVSVEEVMPKAEGDSLSSSYQATLCTLVEKLSSLWENIPSSTRAWDDYFGLLAEIAAMGPQESHILLRAEFLQRGLELLICDHANIRNLRAHPPYDAYCRLHEKGRKFLFTKLIELLANLFERVDFRISPTDENCSERTLHSGRAPLTLAESHYIHFRQAGPKSVCVFLEKILNSAANPRAVKRITRVMILAEPDLGISSQMYHTIASGLNVEPAHLAAPFLHAAITFCECTPASAHAEKIITDVASDVHSIGNNGGKEHLEFFAQARRIRSLRNIEPTDFFQRVVIKCVQAWAPPLLTYWESEVRLSTLELLKILLFQDDLNFDDDEEYADFITDNVKKLCKACALHCQRILQEGKTVGRSAEQITLVIRHSLQKYYDMDDDRTFIAEVTDIVERVQALAISDLEDQVSEWANNSENDLQSDSDTDNLGVSP